MHKHLQITHHFSKYKENITLIITHWDLCKDDRNFEETLF
jgi:hypothetical protein